MSSIFRTYIRTSIFCRITTRVNPSIHHPCCYLVRLLVFQYKPHSSVQNVSVLRHVDSLVLGQSINQSIKSSKRHTSTREATSQRNHTGSKPRDAKRRRLGGLRASRASISLRDSLYVNTLFTEARKI